MIKILVWIDNDNDVKKWKKFFYRCLGENCIIGKDYIESELIDVDFVKDLDVLRGRRYDFAFVDKIGGEELDYVKEICKIVRWNSR